MYLNIQKISVDLKYYDASILRTSKVMLISNRIYMYVCVCLWGQVSGGSKVGAERTNEVTSAQLSGLCINQVGAAVE